MLLYDIYAYIWAHTGSTCGVHTSLWTKCDHVWKTYNDQIHHFHIFSCMQQPYIFEFGILIRRSKKVQNEWALVLLMTWVVEPGGPEVVEDCVKRPEQADSGMQVRIQVRVYVARCAHNSENPMWPVIPALNARCGTSSKMHEKVSVGFVRVNSCSEFLSWEPFEFKSKRLLQTKGDASKG
jgi:hypothetical protein